MDQQKPASGHAAHTSAHADTNFPRIPDGDVIPPAFHHIGPDHSSHWQHFKRWVGAHKKASIGIAALTVLLLASGGVGLYFWLKPKPQPVTVTPPAKIQPTPAPAQVVPKYYSPLTGMPVADEATAKQEVTGIMIENSQYARPQSGLVNAGVVFEAIAEGGITRFAALYQETKPKLIGPVRSVRPYYVDWMAAFDPTIVHVGGSANALSEVRNGAYKDADEFFNGSYFWRATDRFAPHNVYTNFDKLDALNKDKGYTGSTFTGFPRKDDNPPITPNATKINIDISYDLFNVHYDFDKGCNCYERYLAGEKQLDRETGQNVKPKVVIVMRVPTQLGFEDGYREQMTDTGTGTAYVFQDGTVTAGTWTKKSKKDQIQFKDDHGQEIKLNRGQTFISITAPEKSVTWQ